MKAPGSIVHTMNGMAYIMTLTRDVSFCKSSHTWKFSNLETGKFLELRVRSDVTLTLVAGSGLGPGRGHDELRDSRFLGRGYGTAIYSIIVQS